MNNQTKSDEASAFGLARAPWLKGLAQRILENKDHHAWLLHGVSGVGKRTLVQYLGMTVLCEHRNACGRCSACQLYLDGSHPDAHFLIGKKDLTHMDSWWQQVSLAYLSNSKSSEGKILIAQLRELLDNLTRTAIAGKRKLAVLIHADQIGTRSSNVLLKTLEEPYAGTHFILTAKHAASVQPTIRSRCLCFQCHCSDTELKKWMNAAGIKNNDAFKIFGSKAPLELIRMSEKESLYTHLADNIESVKSGRKPLSLVYEGCGELPKKNAFVILFYALLEAYKRLLMNEPKDTSGDGLYACWQRPLKGLSLGQLLFLKTQIIQYFSVAHLITKDDEGRMFEDVILAMKQGYAQHTLDGS